MVGTPPFYRYTRKTRGEADDSDEEEEDNYGPPGDVKRQSSGGPLRPISLSRDVDRHRHGGTESQPGSVHLHNPLGASSSQSSVIRQPSVPAVPESWPPMLPTVPGNSLSSARNAVINSGPALPGLPPAGNLPASAPVSAWEQQAKSLAQLRAQLGLQEAKPVGTPAATPMQPPPNTPLAPLPSPKEMLQNMSQLAKEWRNGAPSASSSFRSNGAQTPAPATPAMPVVSAASANGVSRMVSTGSSNGVTRMSSVEGQKASARFSGVKLLSAGGTGGPTRSRSISRAPSMERFTANNSRVPSTSRGPSVERLVSSGSAVAFHPSTPSRLARSNSRDQPHSGMLSVGATPPSEVDRGPAELLQVRSGPSVRLAVTSEGKSMSFESYTRSVSQAPKSSSFRSRPMVLRRSVSLPGASKSPKQGSLLVPGPLPVPMTPISVSMTPVSMESPSQSGSVNLPPYNRGGSVQLPPPLQASPFPMQSLVPSASQSQLHQQLPTSPQSTPLSKQAVVCAPTPSSSRPTPLPTPNASARFAAPGASPRFPAVALTSPAGETAAPMVALPSGAGGSALLRQSFGSHLVARGGSVGLQAAPGGLTPQVGPRPSARFERAVAEAAALAAAGPAAETSRILQQLAMQHNMQTLPQTPTRPSQQRGLSPGRTTQQRSISPNRPSTLWGVAPPALQQVVAPPMGAMPSALQQQQHQMAPPLESSNAIHTASQQSLAPQFGQQHQISPPLENSNAIHTASQQSLAPQFGTPQTPARPTGARTVPPPSQTVASSDIAAWTWGASPDDDDADSHGIGASLNSTSFSQSMSFLSKSEFDPTYHLAPKLVHL